MRAQPVCYDLFSGAGGCAVGYDRAGFAVVGIDRAPQPHYPFPHIVADALEWLSGWLETRRPHIDFFHASPPCQKFSIAAKGTGKEYPDLLTPCRALLQQTDVPWVIENVPGAPMRADFTLCGCQFGLRLRRKRLFETSWGGFEMMRPCFHDGPVPSVVGHGTPKWVRDRLGYCPSIHEYRACMGIDWMNRDELSQAIPPAYCEFIGLRAMEALAC